VLESAARDLDSAGPSLRPLLTLLGVGALTAAGWKAFGADMHPIIAKSRGLEPPPAISFQVLGLGGAMLSAASLASGWYPLPVALGTSLGGSGLEIAHCALPIALWQIDVRLLRFLNPQVDWPTNATALRPNYKAEYEDSAVAAGLALFGVLMFEVYVQQGLAAQFTLAGWPLLASAALIGLNAGLINHALANGLLNGILCAEFYWTVSLLFGLSNSVLPVAIYHHLMYSMPLFVNKYDEAVSSAPSPAVHATLLHVTVATWHLALFSTLGLVLPTALPLRPPLEAGLSLLPQSPGAGVGLLGVALFGAAAASVTAGVMGGGNEAAEGGEGGVNSEAGEPPSTPP